MRPEDIIIKPIITEKSNSELEQGKYTLKVNTMTVTGKVKRMGAHEGKRPDWKKAIVTIDTNPSETKYLSKGGKEVKVDKKYKSSIEEFMGA